MGKVSNILAIGALAGIGYYVGKKVFDKKKTEKESGAKPEVFVEERHSSPKEKIQRASLFAVGAIKTGTEKIKEGLDEIVDADMISKGETTVEDVKSFAKETKEKTVAFAKEKSTAIKDEIDNLKSMVTSINTGAGEAEETASEPPQPEEESAEDLVETVQDKVEELRSDFAAVKEEAEALQKEVEAVKEEAADELDALSFDGEDTVSVDTFDFSSADKL